MKCRALITTWILGVKGPIFMNGLNLNQIIKEMGYLYAKR